MIVRAWLGSVVLAASTCGAPASHPPETPPPPKVEPDETSPVAPSTKVEGRLLGNWDNLCVALSTGVFCRGPRTHRDPQGRAQRISNEPDIIDLASNERDESRLPDERTLCGRKRGGRVSCWSLGSPRPTAWSPPSPAIATSLVVGVDDRICATGDDGVLWCGKHGDAMARVELPEPVSAVRDDYGDGLCVLGRSGATYCKRDAAPWSAHPEVAYRFSRTIACKRDGATELPSCAWADPSDEALLKHAGRRAELHLEGVREIEIDVVGATVLHGDGRITSMNGALKERDDPAQGRAVPVGVIEIEDGVGTCALTDMDEVWCRGENLLWTLGRGSAPFVPSPLQVDAGPVVELRTADFHTCVRGSGDAWRCWARGFLSSRLDDRGMPEVLRERAPSCRLVEGKATCEVDGGDDVFAVGAKRVYGTGWFGCGELGSGDHTCWTRGGYKRAEKPPAFPIRGSLKLAASGESACVLDGKGATWCWGLIGCLALGVDWPSKPTASPEVAASCAKSRTMSTPMKMPGAPGAKAIAVGAEHACVITSTDSVACLGGNMQGQLGRGTFEGWEPTFVPVLGVDGARQLAAGDNHTCAVRADASLWCWGSNQVGQLANGRVDHVDAWSRWPLGAAEAGTGEPPRQLDGGAITPPDQAPRTTIAPPDNADSAPPRTH